MLQPTLDTERLELRPFKLSDAERVNELAGNLEVAKTTLNIPHPYTEDIARDWICSHTDTDGQKARIVYAITLKKVADVIGAISLINIEGGEARLGYWVGEPYWCSGYCTEAVAAILKFSFEKLRLYRIYATHMTSNPASGRVMEKNGMIHIGVSNMEDRYTNTVQVESFEILTTMQG